MRKLITFCAVMGLILVVSSNMASAIVITTYTYGDGATEWTTETSAVGSSSLKLLDPGNTINYAGAKVTDLGDPTVAEFDGWSYWTRGPEFHGVNFWMGLDTPYDNFESGGVDYGYDIWMGIMPYNILWTEGNNEKVPDDTWVNLQSSGYYPYQVWSPVGGHDISMHPDGTTWSEFQDLTSYTIDAWGRTYDFSAATVKMVVMRMGGGGHASDNTGYLDDFTLDGVTVEVENGFIPEPTTIALLGLGVLGLIRRKR